jgi:hypothetical protein
MSLPPFDARRWIYVVVAVLATSITAVLIVLFGTFLTVGPAAAAPKTDRVACQRNDKLWKSEVVVTSHVANLAKHHCETGSKADENAGLRLKREWAEPRYDAGNLCDYVGSGFAEPGSHYEQIEAECIASWMEYVLYAEAHPNCLNDINATARAWNRNHGNMLNRLDVTEICPDPKFGADQPDPKGDADRKTDKFVLGAFGIGGWLCIAAVVFGVFIAFTSYKGYERS